MRICIYALQYYVLAAAAVVAGIYLQTFVMLRALAACACLAAAGAAVIEGTILPPLVPESKAAAAAQAAQEEAAVAAGSADVRGARVLLDGGERFVTVASDGAFRFSDVSPGVHTLEIVDGRAVYPTYRVQVPSEAGSPLAVLEYKYPGAPKWPSRHPILAAPVAAPSYFDPVATFDPLAMLWRNPMMAIMGGLMLLVLLMQALVSPEELAEGQARLQEEGPMDPVAEIGKLFSSGGSGPPPSPTGPARGKIDAARGELRKR